MHRPQGKCLQVVAILSHSIPYTSSCEPAYVVDITNSTNHNRRWESFQSVCVCIYVAKLYTSITCKKHHSVMALQSTLFFLVVLGILSEALGFHNNSTCPTWMYRSEGECTCGSSLINIIVCDNHTQEVSILDSFCLTSSGAGSDLQKAVVGSCLYGQHQEPEAQWNGAPQYIEVNSNITKQDQDLCEPLNRPGKLCGTFKPNYFTLAYSYAQTNKPL